ncbi:MAG: tRNA pseudouridine(38-40) synthase TruA [Candidatus Cloacimonetes bacterium]|jgi:tRNA pseudouridine38-40 synthase|nr:tRNA pseudouridine(38-40) synthase TruA [Candidatus Cloacimonadota bacterium]MDD4156065.1 tRNA pseudouridine(38-40) synthase TruA [Candidatus Cloacimonadota bacterium]
MKRIALKIAYDGSCFYGWQTQVITPTVQNTIEQVFSKIAKTNIKIIGSGRTDTGVHSSSQIAHLDFPIDMNKQQIILASKSLLPKSIQILDVAIVDDNFNARFDAIERTYKYIITKKQTPFNYRYKSFFPKYNINLDVFQQCATYFVGLHNFTSFSKPNPEVKNYECDIHKLDIYEVDNDIIIEISANRFLHNMVRRIVGAMISVSHKNLKPEIIKEWIDMKKHEQKNFFTALPNGLYLTEVLYPENCLKFDKS